MARYLSSPDANWTQYFQSNIDQHEKHLKFNIRGYTSFALYSAVQAGHVNYQLAVLQYLIPAGNYYFNSLTLEINRNIALTNGANFFSIENFKNDAVLSPIIICRSGFMGTAITNFLSSDLYNKFLRAGSAGIFNFGGVFDYSGFPDYSFSDNPIPGLSCKRDLLFNQEFYSPVYITFLIGTTANVGGTSVNIEGAESALIKNIDINCFGLYVTALLIYYNISLKFQKLN